MRAWIGVLLVAAAVLAGVAAWDALDVALGGPGVAARGLIPAVHLSTSGDRHPGTEILAPTSAARAAQAGRAGQEIVRWGRMALVYELNGWLYILFLVVKNAAVVVVLCFAAACTWIERAGQGATRVLTVIALAATIVAALSVPMPIPAVLAAMWGFVPLVLALDPVGGGTLAWRAKSGILLYTGACVAYVVYIRGTARVTPEAWAALAGGVEEARAVLAQSRAYISTMANIALYVLPAGYMSLMAQALLAHPMPSAPFRTMAERVRLIRTRGVE